MQPQTEWTTLRNWTWSKRCHCHVKTMSPSRRTFCVHHTDKHAPVYTTMSLHSKQPHYVGCMCLAVASHRAFWQNDQHLDHATCRGSVSDRSATDTEIRESTESWPWRRKLVLPAPPESNPRPVSITMSPWTPGALPLSCPRPPVTDWCTGVSVHYKLALKRVRVRLSL